MKVGSPHRQETPSPAKVAAFTLSQDEPTRRSGRRSPPFEIIVTGVPGSQLGSQENHCRAGRNSMGFCSLKMEGGRFWTMRGLHHLFGYESISSTVYLGPLFTKKTSSCLSRLHQGRMRMEASVGSVESLALWEQRGYNAFVYLRHHLPSPKCCLVQRPGFRFPLFAWVLATPKSSFSEANGEVRGDELGWQALAISAPTNVHSHVCAQLSRGMWSYIRGSG